MRYLLDTCSFIWLVAEPAKLSGEAASRLDSEGATILVSDVTTLEIALKWTAGKLTLPEPPRKWIEHQLQVWALEQVPVSRETIYRATELPMHHTDPFDRLLVATALNHDATIVTPEALIHEYPVAWVW